MFNAGTCVDMKKKANDPKYSWIGIKGYNTETVEGRRRMVEQLLSNSCQSTRNVEVPSATSAWTWGRPNGQGKSEVEIGSSNAASVRHHASGDP